MSASCLEKPTIVHGPACDPRACRAGAVGERLHFFAGFPSGARVLDVGCGQGEHLRQFVAQGYDAIGVESDPQAVAMLRDKGLPVVAGQAESLPFDDASFDAVVCSVVVPYTDERQTVREWSRVLAPGGQVRASYHGAAYYLNFVFRGPGWRTRLYGGRSLVNGIYYRLTGGRLPGFWGDTLYQSAARLDRYYARYGLRLVREYIRPGIGGLRDIFFHHLEKTG
jgi:SAM-dependent methyltransferase